MSAMLSVMGLYNYDSTIFDGLQVPDGIDKDSLITYLLYETAEQEVNYSNPEFFKKMVSAWSALNIERWKRIYETYTYDYDPFENYDMTIEETKTRTPNLTQKSVNSGTDESDSFVAGFNDSAGLTQNGKATATLGTENTITNSGNEEETIKRREYGDASVRAIPDVILQERKERIANFIEDVIVPEFMERFCNLCYSL